MLARMAAGLGGGHPSQHTRGSQTRHGTLSANHMGRSWGRPADNPPAQQLGRPGAATGAPVLLIPELFVTWLFYTSEAADDPL
ncbi:hypothetical protein QO159_29830, partial [Pseudomonas aeruginosa]|uniref:hypothetical protein n=1 Tax=Pseudomonas aeruginosa TaxID=287 RepID=UPI002E8E76C8|nr:hypothetical protein [Pseudomonas aeruginosa]